MRLSIIGFGLIGGSVARALAARDAGRWHVTTWSRSQEGPQEGLADGVVDAVAPSAEDAVSGAELVLLAATPLANVELVRALGPAIASSGATLFDVTSAQGVMARAAAEVPGLRHVGGHPMAGVEASGYAAARADLFAGRPWIVLPSPSAGPDDLERAHALVAACGARAIALEPWEHDRLVAATSHLPLVVAAALAEAVTTADSWPEAARLAAGGWRDTTRVARGDPDLGVGMIALNRDEILAWLDRFAATLASWREQVASIPPVAAGTARAAGDPERQLRERFAQVRAALVERNG
ncbi:MAG: prephenate dehydrogenase/arogenate dehydrogenase family protein [Chloroflexi bacterium]|nr:prephenate dehydrogenase/arogenate dehydrogenase family protein [Chloroflexota bacterium]